MVHLKSFWNLIAWYHFEQNTCLQPWLRNLNLVWKPFKLSELGLLAITCCCLPLLAVTLESCEPCAFRAPSDAQCIWFTSWKSASLGSLRWHEHMWRYEATPEKCSLLSASYWWLQNALLGSPGTPQRIAARLRRATSEKQGCKWLRGSKWGLWTEQS